MISAIEIRDRVSPRVPSSRRLQRGLQPEWTYGPGHRRWPRWRFQADCRRPHHCMCTAATGRQQSVNAARADPAGAAAFNFKTAR